MFWVEQKCDMKMLAGLIGNNLLLKFPIPSGVYWSFEDEISAQFEPKLNLLGVASFREHGGKKQY